MAGLAILTDRDFELREIKQQSGLIPGTAQAPSQYRMHHRIQGLSLVLFYANSCGFCQKLQTIYKQLPGKVQGVTFAMANVALNEKRLTRMSLSSDKPIKYVPYLVIYKDGEPFLDYQGPHTIQSISQTMYEVATKNPRQFSQGSMCKNAQGGDAYCAQGYVEDDEKCYTMGEVFGGEKCDPSKGRCSTVGDVFGGKL